MVRVRAATNRARAQHPYGKPSTLIIQSACSLFLSLTLSVSSLQKIPILVADGEEAVKLRLDRMEATQKLMTRAMGKPYITRPVVGCSVSDPPDTKLICVSNIDLSGWCQAHTLDGRSLIDSI
jgi:hypothetical protein